jgi:type IV secretory pathway TrbD component
MTSTRKTATIVGALFLTQTDAFILAEQLITRVLKRPNYLTGVSADANTLTLGGLCAVVSGVAVVGIAVLLFPSIWLLAKGFNSSVHALPGQNAPQVVRTR